MTTEQPKLASLAKQGNAKAIEALMNRSLHSKGITAIVGTKNDCLQIMLESSQVLDQKILVSFIRKGIMSLKPQSIKLVKIYGKEMSAEIPTWTDEFEVVEDSDFHVNAENNNSASNKVSTITQERKTINNEIRESKFLETNRQINQSFPSKSSKSNRRENISTSFSPNKKFAIVGGVVIIVGAISFFGFQWHQNFEFTHKYQALKKEMDTACDAYQKLQSTNIQKVLEAGNRGLLYVDESGEKQKIEQLKSECSQKLEEINRLGKNPAIITFQTNSDSTPSQSLDDECNQLSQAWSNLRTMANSLEALSDKDNKSNLIKLNIENRQLIKSLSNLKISNEDLITVQSELIRVSTEINYMVAKKLLVHKKLEEVEQKIEDDPDSASKDRKEIETFMNQLDMELLEKAPSIENSINTGASKYKSVCEGRSR